MKKIDLTRQVRKVTLNTFSGKFAQLNKNTAALTNPLLAHVASLHTLQNYVIKALNNYTDCTINSSSDVMKLANTLKETPICEISDENFDLIEKALAGEPAHVKAAWNDMVVSLNTEG
jgi:hypothetical protein